LNSQIEKWNERYRQGLDDLPVPLPFFVDVVSNLAPGRALDLACGIGRHSIWLAERGWDVTAIDGSEVAIEQLQSRGLAIQTRIEDMEAPQYQIPGGPYDLIVDTFFLHRPLIPRIIQALKPGGVAIFAFHLTGSFAVRTDELDRFFGDCERLHFVEHQEIPTVEIAIRKSNLYQQ
jgi:tellurite methyltransferase